MKQKAAKSFRPLPLQDISLKRTLASYLRLIMVWVVAFAVSMVLAFAW
jgi:hypothetical protein